MYSRSLLALIFSVVLVVLIPLVACSKGDAPRPEDVAAVRAVMEKRAQAIANKNIEGFEQLLHDEYNDGQNTKADVVNHMRAIFAQHNHITLSYQKSPVELKMNTARLVQRLEYDLDGGKQKVHDHEYLILRKSDGIWKISGGIKTDLF